MKLSSTRLKLLKANTYFISDCHLSDESPELLKLFETLIAKIHGAKALYILGDLFDVWVGDDISTPASLRVTAALKQLKSSGTQLYFMAGNRDFLLGKRFAKHVGWQSLPDYHTFEHNHLRLCLTHGDLLCTDDVAYQKYRKWVRNPIVLWLYRHFPKVLRLHLAAKIRTKSKAYQASVDAQIIDANLNAVEQCMSQHQASYLIHGHTHRSMTHQTKMGKRIVLGDWNSKHAMIAMLNDDSVTLMDAYQLCEKQAYHEESSPKAVSS